MIRRREPVLLPLLLLIAVALFIAACGDVPDRCGYTWKQTHAPADEIRIHYVGSEAEMPAPRDEGDADCRTPGTMGCTRFTHDGGKKRADVYVNTSNRIQGGQCDTLEHEIGHALGRTHPNSERQR